VAGRKKKKPRPTPDPLEAYRRIRKPMPPPERVLPDKRRKAKERAARREMEGDASDEEG
jgi:hypothetical protein